jgi:hypothetical protein
MLKSVRQITTITPHFTTDLPSRNHVLRSLFAKNPCKKHLSTTDKKSGKSQRKIPLSP